MSKAKDLVLRIIDSREAHAFVRAHHYSKKSVNNSSVHFGAYLDGKLEGVLQFGPSLDKANMLGLVRGTEWNGFLELNRMVFTEALPRNSESRAIGVALRKIKQHAPNVRWVVSYADGTQCGDGTIYRAAGFSLTLIKPNAGLARLPSGQVIHEMTLKSAPLSPRPELGGRSFFDITGGKYNFSKYVEAAKAEVLRGNQLRYIYFLDPSARADLASPIVPFSAIDELKAGIYRGKWISRAERSANDNAREA